MITIGVLAILSVIAVPGFRNLIHRNRISAATNSMLGAFAYARSEAVTRGTFVSLCPSTDGNSCAKTSSYHDGWIIYAYPVGTDGPDQAYKDGFQRLRYATALQGVSVIAKDSAVVTYGQLGQLKRDTPSDGSAPVSFVVCSKGGDGLASNDAGAPGTRIDLGGAKAARSKALATDAGCEPS